LPKTSQAKAGWGGACVMKYAKHKANKSLARSRIYRLHLPCRQDEQPSKWRGGKGVRARERENTPRESARQRALRVLIFCSLSLALGGGGRRRTSPYHSGWRWDKRDANAKRQHYTHWPLGLAAASWRRARCLASDSSCSWPRLGG
jgi:hypothetical protein